MVLGGTGPIELNGNQVNIYSPLSVNGEISVDGEISVAGVVSVAEHLTLTGTNYRTNAGVLEYQLENDTWVPVAPVGIPESYDINYLHTMGNTTRTVGYGDNIMGIKVQRGVTLTSVTYRGGTPDYTGNLVVELRKNGSQISGTSKSIAPADQLAGGVNATATGTWALSSGDVLTVYVTEASGNGPGKGLVADICGIRAT